MRDIPSTNGGGDARPVVALVLGVALLAGVFLFVTAGGDGAGPTDVDVRVEVTATPVDGPTAENHTRRLSSFELTTPIHRAVLRATDENRTATVRRTVENGGVVRLDPRETETELFVRRDRPAGTDDEYVRVHVERLSGVEN